MIVKTLQQLERTDRHLASETWDSVRLLLKDDGLGVSFHITTMSPGGETRLWYKNHLEAVFCMEGEGEVETLADGKVYPIGPGTIYILDKHDRHILRAKSRMRNACLFSPPLTGGETLDANGCYPLAGELVED